MHCYLCSSCCYYKIIFIAFHIYPSLSSIDSENSKKFVLKVFEDYIYKDLSKHRSSSKEKGFFAIPFKATHICKLAQACTYKTLVVAIETQYLVVR